jgi:hypothetical protein
MNVACTQQQPVFLLGILLITPLLSSRGGVQAFESIPDSALSYRSPNCLRRNHKYRASFLGRGGYKSLLLLLIIRSRPSDVVQLLEIR